MELREKDTQKVVAGLKCCIPHIQQCSDCYLKERKDNCYGTLLMDAVQHIEELKNKNERLGELLVRKTALDGGRAQRPSPTMEWISVEDERKPKEGESCIVRSSTDCITIRKYEKGGFPDNHRIRYWIHNPALPKPKEPTFKDVFLEKFPKALTRDDGSPKACIRTIFPYIRKKHRCGIGSCSECWNQPYFDEEGEEE